MPLMVKGYQHWVSLDNRPFVSDRVPVFKSWSRSGHLTIYWDGRLWFWVQMEVNVLSSVTALAAELAVLVCCL